MQLDTPAYFLFQLHKGDSHHMVLIFPDNKALEYKYLLFELLQEQFSPSAH